MENYGYPKILQVDNGGEFSNNILDEYCEKNHIKLIHSTFSFPQTNGSCEVYHKKIRQFIYEEFLKNKRNFNIKEELLKINKIHNNKFHSTTGCIPKEIRDIVDEKEIELIKKNIIKILTKKNKNKEIINLDGNYVIDFSMI